MIKFIDIHVHKCKTSDSIVSFRFGVDEINAGSNDFMVGVHPWDVGLYLNFKELESFLSFKHVVALGEVGLDYSVVKSDDERRLQRDVFIKQIEIANNFNLPLIIHSVKSNGDVLALLKKHNKTSDVIFHGFIGNLCEAAQILDMGYYLSFSVRALKSNKTRAVFSDVDLERVFCETDDTDDKIEDVYSLLAELRGEELEFIKIKIFNNYKKIFKK